MSDETTVAPEATETEAAPEASTAEVAAADSTTTEPTQAEPVAAPEPAPPAPPAPPRQAVNAALSTPDPADGKDYTPEELIQALEASFHDFGDGDIVEGDVVKIDRDEVLLDIGYKSEGVIPSKELSIRHDVDPNEVVKVGDHIEALVLQKEDKEGRLILSKKRAQYERAWGRIEEVMNSGQTIKGPVIEVVKGGSDPRHRPARLPAGVARRPAARARPAPVRGHRARGEDHRARPQPQQRRALAPRLPRGVAERGPQEVPRRPAEGRAAQGHGQLDRELRRVRRPRRRRRARARERAAAGSTSTTRRRSSPWARRSRSRCSTSTSSASASRSR